MITKKFWKEVDLTHRERVMYIYFINLAMIGLDDSLRVWF